MYQVICNSNWREVDRFPTLAEARSEAFRLGDCTIVDASTGNVVPDMPDTWQNTGSDFAVNENVGFCKTNMVLEECTRLGIPVEVIKSRYNLDE